MPVLAKQPVQVVFGAANQKTQGKQLRPGLPTIAQNVIQTKTGSYAKRGGWAVTDRTTDTGSITTGKDLVVDGGVPILRTADAIYARPASRWLKRGDYVACVPSQTVASANRATHPLLVVVGTQNWNFVQGSDGKWYYQVTDSGVEVVAPTLVFGTAVRWGRAVSTTGKVWLFVGPPSGGGNTITAFKFDTASPATAPVSTTFANPTGVSVDAFDVLDGSVNGNGVVMAVGSADAAGIAFGGASRALFFGRLDTATGLVDGTGWLGDATITLGQFSSPAAWVRTGQSAATLHYLSRRSTNNHTFLTAVTAASLVSSTTDLGTPVITPGISGSIAGYRVAASGNIVIFATDSSSTAENATITKATWDGATLTSNGVLARARLTVADPFLIGTTPYLVCHHADGSSSALQNSYYVLDASAAPGRVVARALYGLGSNAGQIGDLTSFTNTWWLGWICPVVVSGNQASVLVGSTISGTYTLVKLTFDFAPTASTVGPPVVAADGNLVALAGGWPSALAGGGSLADVTPGMFPRASWTGTAQTVTSALAAGTYIGTVLYAVVDSHGSIQRSAASAVQTATLTAGQAFRFGTVPSLRVANTPSAQVFVEYYLTDPNEDTLFLVRRVANDATADTITNQDIIAAALDGAEEIYTSGGALEHVSAPPWKWAATWRNRVIVGGTESPDAEVWPSFELSPGLGVAFSDTLKFRVPDGTGKDTAGCAVDFNFFAIAKTDSIWTISGAGPDPVGTGSYGGTLQQVVDAPGSDNPRSWVQTPLGAMYQAKNGGIWLITRGGGARYLGESWADHQGATVVAAVHSPYYELVLFFLDSSVVLVWDYGNPLPEQGSPLGQGYTWTLPAAPVAAAVSGANIYFLDGTGVMYTYTSSTYSDNGSAILRKLKLPIVLSGMRGYQRLYRGHVVGQFIDTGSLKVTVDAYAGAAGEAGSSSQPFGPRVVSAGPYLFEFKPNAGKVSVFDVTLEDTGTDLHAAATWDGLALEVGLKGGLPRIGTGQRIT